MLAIVHSKSQNRKILAEICPFFCYGSTNFLKGKSQTGRSKFYTKYHEILHKQLYMQIKPIPFNLIRSFIFFNKNKTMEIYLSYTVWKKRILLKVTDPFFSSS